MRTLGRCPSCKVTRYPQNTSLISIDESYEIRSCRCGRAFNSARVIRPDEISLKDWTEYTCTVCPDDLNPLQKEALGLTDADFSA